MFSLVLAVGVVGNVLVLIVILTSKSMRSSTNLFLLNLSIADLLVLIVCCPNAMIEMYMRTVSNTQPNTTLRRTKIKLLDPFKAYFWTSEDMTF